MARSDGLLQRTVRRSLDVYKDLDEKMTNLKLAFSCIGQSGYNPGDFAAH